MNRPLLSVFCSVYAFQNTQSVRGLWWSVRRELTVLLGLLPFCRRDLRNKPSGFVYASDACPSGLAVAKAVADPLDVREITAVDERWQFREVGHGTARVEALSSDFSVSPPENGREVSSHSAFGLSSHIVGKISSFQPLVISEPSILKKLIPRFLV